MIGRTLQSLSEILSEHANEHHELDKKKGRKPSFAQRGRPAQPGRKPHGQVKPRQQRGTAHGQRAVKAEGVKRPILGPGPQHVSGPWPSAWTSAGGRAGTGHNPLARPPVKKHETEENPEHSHDPTGGGYKREPAYGIRWTEYNRQDQRVKREKIFTSDDARETFIRRLVDKPNFGSIEAYLDEDDDVKKQHHSEYPEEWGPKHLYQKIGEEVEKIDNALSSPRRTLTDEEVYRPIHGRGAYEQTSAGESTPPRPAPKKPKKGSVHPAFSRTHESPPYGTRAYETWKQTQKALDEVKKAVGGCPAGWHKHEPYDYCHPTKRAHRGQTRMKPAGGVDDAHGVIDQAIVQAHAIGSKVAVEAFGQIKDALGKYGDDPERAFKALSVWQNFYTKTAASVSDPRQRMAMSMVADVLRRAAAKAKPKPEVGAGMAHAGMRQMDDKQLSSHYDALIDYLRGDQAAKLAPEVRQEYVDRARAASAELGRRAQAHRGRANA